MFLKNLNAAEKNAFYSLAVGIIQADGVIEEKETVMLSALLEEMETPEPVFLEFDKALKLLELSDKKTLKQIFLELVAVSMSDDDFANEERSMLDAVSSSFGFTAEEVDEMERCIFDLIALYARMGDIISK